MRCVGKHKEFGGLMYLAHEPEAVRYIRPPAALGFPVTWLDLDPYMSHADADLEETQEHYKASNPMITAGTGRCITNQHL